MKVSPFRSSVVTFGLSSRKHTMRTIADIVMNKKLDRSTSKVHEGAIFCFVHEFPDIYDRLLFVYTIQLSICI